MQGEAQEGENTCHHEDRKSFLAQKSSHLARFYGKTIISSSACICMHSAWLFYINSFSQGFLLLNTEL